MELEIDDQGKATANQAQPISRLKINDTKAGMQNIDKEKINAIILKHSQSMIYNNNNNNNNIQIQYTKFENLHFKRQRSFFYLD
jgi:hypothetical protein